MHFYEPETGWLIEGQMEAAGQSYVGVVGGPHKNFAIVYDASRALRLGRREDAQTLIDNIPWFRNCAHKPLRVAEHSWESPAVDGEAKS